MTYRSVFQESPANAGWPRIKVDQHGSRVHYTTDSYAGRQHLHRLAVFRTDRTLLLFESESVSIASRILTVNLNTLPFHTIRSIQPVNLLVQQNVSLIKKNKPTIFRTTLPVSVMLLLKTEIQLLQIKQSSWRLPLCSW